MEPEWLLDDFRWKILEELRFFFQFFWKVLRMGMLWMVMGTPSLRYYWGIVDLFAQEDAEKQMNKNPLLFYFDILYVLPLDLNFKHQNDLSCIWAQLMKWSYISLISTPISNHVKSLKLNISLRFWTLNFKQGLSMLIFIEWYKILVYTIMSYSIIGSNGESFNISKHYLYFIWISLPYSSEMHNNFKISSKVLKILGIVEDMWFHL